MKQQTRTIQLRPLGDLYVRGIVATAAGAYETNMIVARTRSGRTIAQPEQRKTDQATRVDGALTDLHREELVNAQRWNDTRAWPVTVRLEGEQS